MFETTDLLSVYLVITVKLVFRPWYKELNGQLIIVFVSNGLKKMRQVIENLVALALCGPV